MLQVRLRPGVNAKARYMLRSVADTFQQGLSLLGTDSAEETAASASAKNTSHWSTRSEAWEKWAEPTRTRSAEISKVLMRAAEVRAGDRILDLACGVGDTSLELCPVVGNGGQVVAVDLAFDMAVHTLRRASAEQLQNVQVCAAAMESLPFIDQSLDGIVCRLGIMYSPRVRVALSEARRVLRPGKWAAYLVCGPREDNPILKIVHEVITELFELSRSDSAIDPFRFAQSGSLVREMKRAGFEEVEEFELSQSQRAPAGSRFWLPSIERGLSLSFDEIPKDTRTELERRLSRRFERYRAGDFYVIPGLSRITRGRCRR